MTNHFSHVHWGFDNGEELAVGSVAVGRTTCPFEWVLTPDGVAALRRLLNGEA